VPPHVAVGVVGLLAVAAAAAKAAMTVEPADRFAVTGEVLTDVPAVAVAAVEFVWRTAQATATSR